MTVHQNKTHMYLRCLHNMASVVQGTLHVLMLSACILVMFEHPAKGRLLVRSGSKHLALSDPAEMEHVAN